MEPTAATIRECLGSLVFGEEDDELEDAVVRLLAERGRTLATVEWGTRGLLANVLGNASLATDSTWPAWCSRTPARCGRRWANRRAS